MWYGMRTWRKQGPLGFRGCQSRVKVCTSTASDGYVVLDEYAVTLTLIALEEGKLVLLEAASRTMAPQGAEMIVYTECIL
jgi:hypothetical protein